jgi:hypothetical protein
MTPIGIGIMRLRQHNGKRQVDSSSQPKRKDHRDETGDTADQPEHREPDQRRTVDRWSACPVGDGRQHEAGDGRRHEAEQHGVDVPGERIEAARQRAAGREEDDP